MKSFKRRRQTHIVIRKERIHRKNITLHTINTLFTLSTYSIRYK